MTETNNFFEAFNSLNVLIVGDVMIDRYLTGKVTRVSPEAPVPVVHLQDRENRLGGAANVALNIKALGATPYLCSVIGDDTAAKQFLRLLPKHELSTKGIIKSTERQTTVKTRVIASNQHLIRVDTEDSHDLSSEETKQYLDNIKSILDSTDIHVILFQDYNKGVLSLEVIRELILESLKRDIPTVVDPKHRNFLAYKHVSLFKPNLKEIRESAPFSIQPELGDLAKAARFLQEKLGNQYTMITLSELGIFIDDANKCSIIGTQARNIADVCGAGDTVISVAALGIALSLDIKEVAILANLAGGQVCEKVGVVPVDKKQLQEEYVRLITI